MQSVEHRQQEVLVELDVSWKHPQMPLHSRSSMRFRNARSGLFERYCDPSSASPVTVGRRRTDAWGARRVVAAPSNRPHPDGSFLIHATRSVPPATVIGSPSNSGTFV